MKLRISLSILLLVSILFWPLWLSLLIALVGMAYFHRYFEAILLFFLSDVIYGVNEPVYYGIVALSVILITILLFVVEILKKKLKFYIK